MKKGRKAKSILLKQDPLYRRYPDMDYPQNSEEESRETRAKFETLIGGGMDALQTALTFDFGEEEVEAPREKVPPREPPREPLREEPPRELPREEPPQEAPKKGRPFTLGRGVYGAVCWNLFLAGSRESPLYQTPGKDEERRAELFQIRHDEKTTKDLLAELAASLNAHLLSGHNAEMVEFYRLLTEHPYLRVTQDGGAGPCAWSGEILEERAQVCLFNEERDGVSGVCVHPDVGTILSVAHQVNHFAYYVCAVVLEEAAVVDAHHVADFFELRKRVMPAYAGESNILQWKTTKCSPFERRTLELFCAINIAQEWTKRTKK